MPSLGAVKPLYSHCYASAKGRVKGQYLNFLNILIHQRSMISGSSANKSMHFVSNSLLVNAVN